MINRGGRYDLILRWVLAGVNRAGRYPRDCCCHIRRAIREFGRYMVNPEE
jgi:hypothetical protein